MADCNTLPLSGVWAVSSVMVVVGSQGLTQAVRIPQIISTRENEARDGGIKSSVRLSGQQLSHLLSA